MRNVQILIFFIIIIIVASFVQKEGLSNKQIQKKNIMTPALTPASNSADAIPTSAPSQSPTLIPSTSTPVPSAQKNISAFVYPGSIILNQSEDKMTLQSTDDPQAITNWYKEKLISLNMKAKSFVTTNTNGNILNKLVGAGNGLKVKIQIEKDNTSSTTAINISIE